jgi:hypothetical protein
MDNFRTINNKGSFRVKGGVILNNFDVFIYIIASFISFQQLIPTCPRKYLLQEKNFMQYIKLDKNEIKELRNAVRENLGIYPVIFVLSLIIFTAFIKFTILRTEAFQLDYLPILAITLLIAVIFLVLFFKSRLSYFKDIVSNKKKIYSGILAGKEHLSKNGKDKFYFYMDGNKFSVKKEEFEKFREFDTIQFHLSIHSRHIFKISGDTN